MERLKYDSGLKRLVKEAWIVSLGTLVESEISPKSLFLSSGGDSVKAMHFHARLLMTAGIKSDEPLLLTCILEKSFREITECFALLLKNRSQKCNANGVASQNLRLGRKCDFSDIANQSQILCSVSRGQICFHQTNFSALAAEPAAMSKFCEFWKVDFGKCIDASPLAVQYLNGAAIVCIGSHSGKFACIDVHSGTELWSIFLGDRIEATASLSSFGTFFIGCYDGALYNVDRDGKVLWKFQTKGTIKSSAVTSMENIIFGSYDQSLYCVNQKSGDLVWEQQLHRGAIYANPVVHGNLVIVATLGGYVVCVDVEQGSEVWQLHQGKPFFSTPLQLDKKLVMRVTCFPLLHLMDLKYFTLTR
ncbi:Hypothetical predicted protein [Cloeon dipterum]|uniref:Pyrrolo-quinoline quinone repeat domain-containing protein n=1 Tax=Cloeon dipterum TaxID=197152 RepID=A0A8S1CWW6_9INSE|nr:Hypothetical predicted protein [Cloeon dipterum]